jgi:hypothetical protein
LNDHPDLVGKKVQITGDLTAYFSVPGHKNADSYQFVDSTPPEPQVEKITADPLDGIVSKGTKVTLSSETKDAAIYYTLDGSGLQ